jgi:hypothetical protein
MGQPPILLGFDTLMHFMNNCVSTQLNMLARTWTHDYEADAHSSTDLHLVSDADDSFWHLDEESEDDSNSFDESEDYSEPCDETIAQPSGLVCSGNGHIPPMSSHSMKCLVSHAVTRTALHPQVLSLAHEKMMDYPQHLHSSK